MTSTVITGPPRRGRRSPSLPPGYPHLRAQALHLGAAPASATLPGIGRAARGSGLQGTRGGRVCHRIILNPPPGRADHLLLGEARRRPGGRRQLAGRAGAPSRSSYRVTGRETPWGTLCTKGGRGYAHPRLKGPQAMSDTKLAALRLVASRMTRLGRHARAVGRTFLARTAAQAPRRLRR
jgi:hypothetical protein